MARCRIQCRVCSIYDSSNTEFDVEFKTKCSHIIDNLCCAECLYSHVSILSSSGLMLVNSPKFSLLADISNPEDSYEPKHLKN